MLRWLAVSQVTRLPHGAAQSIGMHDAHVAI